MIIGIHIALVRQEVPGDHIGPLGDELVVDESDRAAPDDYIDPD